jgi:hypothetical protein
MNAKNELLSAIAPLTYPIQSRSEKKISDNEKVKILSAVEQLEDQNPHPQPFKNPQLLQGNWRLLYTSSKSLLGLNNIPLLEVDTIFQSISVNPQQVYNIAEIKGLPFLDSVIIAIAKWEQVDQKRISVKFNRTIIGLKNLLNYQSPQQFITKIHNNQKFYPFDISINKNFNTSSNGWLEITYLDQDLRISRGNQGSIFILSKSSAQHK